MGRVPGRPRIGGLRGDARSRASKAVDGDTTTSWQSSLNPEGPQWVEFASPTSISGTLDSLTVLADVMRGRGRGSIVAFSSVAGVRVRRANYVYGSAKAGLDGFASGLADALHGSGIDLVIARPGFVVGRMTRGMAPAVFSSTPDQVADAVVARLRGGGPVVVWIPWQLRVMFAVAPFVPRAIWRRMPR